MRLYLSQVFISPWEPKAM
uniref:Uncharacterized protein n=1 Tax=Anguilla anguilla TaxID=7936 RepID=A0A0E9Q6A1_ANGAN